MPSIILMPAEALKKKKISLVGEESDLKSLGIQS